MKTERKREVIGLGGGDLDDHTLSWWAEQALSLPPANRGGEMFNQGVRMARELKRLRSAPPAPEGTDAK